MKAGDKLKELVIDYFLCCSVSIKITRIIININNIQFKFSRPTNCYLTSI